MTLVTPGETLTSLRPPQSDVKGFGAWLLVALAGLLGGTAIVAAAAGFAHPSLWPAALLAGAASYGLWSYGRERMADAIHERVEGGVGSDGGDGGREERRRTVEDWHYRGFDYSAERDREYDPDSESDADGEWVWEDPFWTDGDRRDPRSGAERTDGSGAREARATAGAGGGADTSTGTETGSDAGTGTDATGRGTRGAGGRAGDAADAGPDVSAAAASEVLGVDADADAEEIRRAYRRRVKETHPDLGGSEAAFRRVRRAYERLREE
jgi:hypothetical protein